MYRTNDERLLADWQVFFLLAGFCVVYLSGLFIPLMENDSAQHATMAMRMALDNDFLNIIKGGEPYLDKPHLHFWFAAASMKIFGINAVAYRIPALLALVLAAFSIKKITDLLYGNGQTGIIAALIFLSAQTIILSAHDVRTDAVLTGFIAFAIWQFLRFIKTQSVISAVFAGLGTAMAFSAKGQMAVVIIGFCILSYLLYSREWRQFFNVKVFIAALAFVAGILPVVYAYWHQFGLEGVEFILFSQSLNRLNATGFEETSPDYFFFFHTLLWAFLPFSLLFYCGVFQETLWFFRNKFRKIKSREFLTLGGFWLVILLFSFSKFKLPHYLNGLIPVLSVFTAAFLVRIYAEKKYKFIRILWIIQIVVFSAGAVAVGLLAYYFSGVYQWMLFAICAVLFAFLFWYLWRWENIFSKYLFTSLLFAVAVNLFLNTQFYPVLSRYQGGLRLAEFVNKNHMDTSKIFMPKDYGTWTFDFYTKRNIVRKDGANLNAGDLLLINEEDLQKLKRPYQIVKSDYNFRITRLSLKFLNPNTRPSQLGKYYLVKISQ